MVTSKREEYAYPTSISTALADVIMTLPAKAIAESLVKFFIFTSLVLKPVRSLFLPWLRV